MTAETLKSFIALPSSGSRLTYNSNKSKRNVNLIMICMLTIISLVCLTLLGFLIFNATRINELEKQVDSLKKTVDNMQKRLGLDYLDDLNEFEEAYSNDLLEDAHHGDLLDSFDDEEEDDFDVEEDGSGTYEFDDENYDDSDDGTISEDVDTVYEDVLKFLGSKKKRQQRSITSRTGSSDLGTSLYESKTVGRNSNEFEIVRQNNDESDNNLNIDDSVDDDIELHNRGSRKRNSNIFHGFRRRKHHQHHRRGDFSIHRPTGRYLVKRRSGNNRHLKSDTNQKYEEHRRQGSSSQLAALHYILNGTLSNHEHHPHHEGNPRLLHDGDVYVGHIQPWVKGLAMDKYFEVENGVVKISESGIYLIYAQIFYHNHMDRNGFFVYHNSHPFLQCALTVPTNTLKGNTCYTSGVTYLEQNDTIHLRDLFRERVVNLRGSKSFFGMVKLTDTDTQRMFKDMN